MLRKLWKLMIGTGVITILVGLVYVSAQQILRQTANDPQIQLSEDGVVPNLRVDISKSLAPFVVVFNASGMPIGGNGYLDNQLPRLPIGVFDYTRTHNQDRITWQPRASVRIAAVITYKNSQFILAGRSLREVETREQNLQFFASAAWVAAEVGIGLLVLV